MAAKQEENDIDLEDGECSDNSEEEIEVGRSHFNL